MDVDVFVAMHWHEWDRLDELSRRRGRLNGTEADELVTLYRRTSTHLSVVRSGAPDPALISRLSGLVARARSAVTAQRRSTWREVVHYLTERLPAALYLSARWWGTVAFLFLLLSTVIAAWVATHPEVQDAIAAPEEIRRLTRPGGDFETYYSSSPASSFAAQVTTNNALIAAACLASGILLGIPVIYVLFMNAVNVAVSAGLMADAGRLDVFFGLITPHGLLELTAVFVAAGAGLKFGWTMIDPGDRTRASALAAQGRVTIGLVPGLALILLVSGIIEAVVTPSGLPTWGRVGIGVAAECAFLAYVFVLGRRAALAGERGDVASSDAGDELPTTG